MMARQSWWCVVAAITAFLVVLDSPGVVNANFCSDGTIRCYLADEANCGIFTIEKCWRDGRGCMPCNYGNDELLSEDELWSYCGFFKNCRACRSGLDYKRIRAENNCENCPDNSYGEDCNQRCPDTCLQCDDGPQGSGLCFTCLSGWFGSSCSNNCSDSCVDGCDDGPTGSGMCNACQAGVYGEFCQLGCSRYCEECSHDGQQGGSQCTKCPPGRYEPSTGCRMICSCPNDAACNDQNGECYCPMGMMDLDNGQISRAHDDDAFTLQCSDMYWPFVAGIAALSRFDTTIQCNPRGRWDFADDGRGRRPGVDALLTVPRASSPDEVIPETQPHDGIQSGRPLPRPELPEESNRDATGLLQPRSNRETDDFQNRHLLTTSTPREMEGEVRRIRTDPTAFMNQRGLNTPDRHIHTVVLLASDNDRHNFQQQTRRTNQTQNSVVTGPFPTITLHRSQDGQYAMPGRPSIVSYLELGLDSNGIVNLFVSSGPPISARHSSATVCERGDPGQTTD